MAMYEIITTNKLDCENIKDFCQIMEMDNKKISRIKAGERDVNILEAEKICRLFGVNPDWLILNRGNKFM